MELTEHTPGNHHQIRGIEPSRVFITDAWYERSVVVGARYIDADWPVRSLAEFDADRADALIELGPELIVLGVGRAQQFLDIAIQQHFMRRGIGIECMTLDAAARTFNVLMSEDRRALAALIIDPAGSRPD
jgi:uncharacterized protein